MTDWNDIWPESIDPETGEDASQPYDGPQPDSGWAYPDNDQREDEE